MAVPATIALKATIKGRKSASRIDIPGAINRKFDLAGLFTETGAMIMSFAVGEGSGSAYRTEQSSY
jgi:hypothetical protein